jgi:hypothetical protein
MKNGAADKLTYLYRYYDRFGSLLYVGITENPEQRMRAHTATKFWWSDVAETKHMAFETREQALWAEWAVITTCHPVHNITSVLPPRHRCSDPVAHEPQLPIDGYIYMVKKLAEIEENRPAYDKLHRQIDDLLGQSGIALTSARPHGLTLNGHDPLPHD